MTPFGRPRAPRGRALLQLHVEAAAYASVRPDPAERFLVYDADPLTVLLIGSGIAVGYGVAHREHALDGRLSTRLAEALGRGVIVNNQAEHGLRLADQLVTEAVSLRSGLVDLVVWCPSYVEMADRTASLVWQRRLGELLAMSPSAPVVVLELPVPVGPEPAAVVAGPIIARINARVRRVAAARSRVVAVAPPPVLIRPLGTPLFDAAYYAELGRLVADAALPLLGAGVTAPYARQR